MGGGLGNSFSARHSQGFLGNRGNTSFVNNYNSFGGRSGGYGGSYWGGRGYGYGWGSRSFGYGFGYPYLGFGYGLGRGLLSSLLYGGYGYGGYGGFGYNRFGYGGFGGYGNNWGYGGYGNGYAYNPYGAGTIQYANYGISSAAPITYVSGSPLATTGTVVAPQPQNSSTDTAANAGGFADKGESAFKAGDYKGAVYVWRHAVIDDPKNPVVLMMLGQALFATGQFDEAAGATQSAMQMLPKDQWGVVANNYKELYGSVQDYTDQLRVLEKGVADKPDDPAQRFLLGFHYAYLGYPQQAVDQLDKVLKIAPTDESAKQLRDEMRAKLPKPAAPAVAPPTPQVPPISR